MKYLAYVLLFASSTSVAAQDKNDMSPKPASTATRAAQEKTSATLPVENGTDAKLAARGFIATRSDPIIRDEDGKPVWNLDAYGWMDGEAPSSVNPSLWRHQKLLAKHGLYKLADHIWQVRGFDLSNMTVIQGQSGWILIDPLTNRETAAAALELVNKELGERPVKALIYTHSHADHFGGARGVASEADVLAGKVAVIAPEHFVEETASENVIAGAAMARRANYQFGGSLTPGVSGQIGNGIGSAVGGGNVTLLTPTDIIKKTGETRVIDGVTIEFQMTPNSEAPSEMNIFFPAPSTLVIGELATCTMHNILTPRGAKVRDTLAWAGYLNEAINLYADRTDTFAASHCWPRFGRTEVRKYLTLQRDNYKFLHDQTVRLMNKGYTPNEIAEAIAPPAAIAAQWGSHGYYGTYSHNSKAIYQYYLGWYDAVPANLNPLPPSERGAKYVKALGGPAQLIVAAKTAMAAGEYRWSSEILNHLVFADPKNITARALLADSYEQQGYQAESGIWRNMFLSAARDLREGNKGGFVTQSIDLISAISTDLLLNSVATRLDPALIGDKAIALNFNITDRSEKARITISNSTMITELGVSHTAPAATLSGPRMLFLGLLFQKAPLAQMENAGLRVEGDRAAVETYLAAIEPLSGTFNIAEP